MKPQPLGYRPSNRLLSPHRHLTYSPLFCSLSLSTDSTTSTPLAGRTSSFISLLLGFVALSPYLHPCFVLRSKSPPSSSLLRIFASLVFILPVKRYTIL
eukprot:m.58585 g.58585  ORF g.58585 m.58585 type:complete len:99 (-) comp13158_c0_seq1:1663-1959(-)